MDFHQKQKNFLSQGIKLERLAHAYLFIGESGVGKERVAKWLVEEIKKGADDPWLSQVWKVYPEYPEKGGRGTIKIDQIREVKHRTALRPSGGGRQIILIYQAQMMNAMAQDALLKVLEEPKNQTIFILLSDYLESLSSTIQSRCQILYFTPLSIFQSAHWLIEQGLSPEKANEIALYSQGKLDLILELKDNPKMAEERIKEWKQFDKILEQPLSERFSFAEKMSKERESFAQLLESWLRYWRAIMLVRAMKLKVSDGWQKNIALSQIADQIEKLEQVETILRSVSLNKRLALERILI